MRNPTKSPTTANALPVKYKVTIGDGTIMQDGLDVGYMYSAGGRAHVTVTVDGKREFFACVRHLRSPMSKARTMVKDILSRMTPAEYLAEYAKPTREPVRIDPTRTKSPYEIQTQVLGFATTREFHVAVFGPPKPFPFHLVSASA